MRKHLISVLFVCVSVFYMVGSASAYELGPTTPGKWGGAVMGTPGGTVTWSLMDTGTIGNNESAGLSYTALEDFMPSGFKAEIENAFDAWSSVADITFLEVADDPLQPYNTSGSSGDIRFGGHTFDGVGGTLAHGFFPPVNGNTAAGDIHFDIVDIWKIGFGGPGFDIFQVAAHEIGHAIGLRHTAVPNSLMNPSYTESFTGLQADDIAGAQFIYGSASAAVPEPSTIVLFGIGVLGVLGYGWRRRKLSTKECL